MSDINKQKEFELVRQAQAGDENSFEELVKLYDKKVLQFVLYMTGNLADAQDIYQETFIRAFLGLAKFKFQSSFSTWLMRIATNQSINFRKKKKLTTFFSISSGDSEKENIIFELKAESDPLKTISNKELEQQITYGLQKLTDKERAVFSLKHFQDYKIKQIAKILNNSEGTIKNLLFRATRKLRKSLIYYQNV